MQTTTSLRRSAGRSALGLLAALVLAVSPAAAVAPATPLPGHWTAIGPETATFLTSEQLAAGQVVFGARMGPDGRLYAFGYFQDAGGDPTADSIAVYDPGVGHWAGIAAAGATDGDIQGVVMDIAWFHGTLYAAGGFNAAGSVKGIDNLAAWNGTTWTWRGAPGAFNGPVTALVVAGDRLYAGGSFTNVDQVADAGAPGDADGVAVFDGRTWTGLPGAGGVLSEVYKLAVGADGAIYAVGGFVNAAGGKADHIARWDPVMLAWGPIGGPAAVDDAIAGSIYALAVKGDRIYIGGDFDVAGVPAATNLAVWTAGAWASVGGVPDLSAEVHGIAFSGSNVIVTGCFTSVAGVPGTAAAAAWNGSRWLALGGGATTACITQLEISGRTAYAMGNFPSMVDAGAPVARTVGAAAFGLPGGPSAPRSPVATTGSKRVMLSWQAPATANGSPITDYVIQYRKAGTTTWKTVNDGVRTTRSALVTGLATGTTYEFRVRALNAWAAGSNSVVVRKAAG